MGQAIAVDCGLFFIYYWVGREFLGPCSENAVKAMMEGHGRIVWYYRFDFSVLYLGFIWMNRSLR
jgi:hypothetical protein